MLASAHWNVYLIRPNLEVMMSFIVIGRNEEKNLDRTISGIYRAAETAKLKNFEIIYVDSMSTDRSIEIAAGYNEVRIFILKEYCNAAIARNVGAKEAKGNSFFFIDGDMEISGEFLGGVWDEAQQIINKDFVSGQLIDIEDGKARKRNFSKIMPGGIFLMKRSVWEKLGGMNTKFNAGEDYDIGLRSIEHGYKFFRKPEIIANHYTVPVLNASRIWKAMKSKYSFFPRCVLLREHLANSTMYYLLWKNDKPFILFVITLLTLIISPITALILFVVYLFAVSVRAAQHRKYLPFGQMFMYFLLFDILNLVYLFTFFPEKRPERYERYQPSAVLQPVN